MSTRTFEFRSEYARRLHAEGFAEGWAKGLAEGCATAVLETLEARGFDVPKEVRARITACSDIGQLKIWVRRAAVIHTIDQL
jgi:hypothetical protein